MTIEKAMVVADVGRALAAGDETRARDMLQTQYPFEPVATVAGRLPQALAMRVYQRDGFVDRYSGRRLIFPAALRVVSELLPREFPHQNNWKMDVCHFGYYELSAVVDHVKPRARGGTNDMANLVTTSTVRNSAKSNFTLEELGWKLLDDTELDKWDGMTGWFFEMTERQPKLLEVSDIRGWWHTAREGIERGTTA
jgi:5-methylcytosine-specific restriction endonuclease McrA